MERVSSAKSFGGEQAVWKHASTSLACDMRVAVFMPPPASIAQETCGQ